MMQLYGVRGWGSAIAEGMLALAGQAYEFVDVDGFDRPGQARDRLAAVNPLVQVPVLLLDDGTVMTETAAIALMLSDRAPGLAPAPNTPERARFYRLLVWLVANVYPTFTYGDYPERWAPSAAKELAASTDGYRETLYRWLEQQVAEPFVLGDAVSALDVYVAAMVTWRPRTPWFERNTPKLARVADRTRRLPAIVSVMTANGMV
jgi:GST-like protein